MATNRTSQVINVVFRIPENFMWGSEDNISALRGGNVVTDTVNWTQGDPEVASFGISDITVLYFSDTAGTTAITSGDTAYDIGDQTLADIITVTNFTGAGSMQGTVDVQVDPGGIDSSELTALLNIYVRLSVSQPDPDD